MKKLLENATEYMRRRVSDKVLITTHLPSDAEGAMVVTMNDEKNIEIVNGNGDLNISPVTDYIEIEKPRPKITEEIVIPEEKKKI